MCEINMRFNYFSLQFRKLRNGGVTVPGMYMFISYFLLAPPKIITKTDSCVT